MLQFITYRLYCYIGVKEEGEGVLSRIMYYITLSRLIFSELIGLVGGNFVLSAASLESS